MPRLPLIEELTEEAIPSGYAIMLVYDPASSWKNLFSTMAAGWLSGSGKIRYIACAEPLENVRARLNKLRVDAERLEASGTLLIRDGYTATLGLKSKETYAIDTLKVSELSISFVADIKSNEQMPESLRIVDDEGIIARFNEEKSWVEYVLTRVIPQSRVAKLTTILGFIGGFHGERVYKMLEAAHDGVVDLRQDENEGQVRNSLRIRAMRDVPFDSRWHALKIGDNFEVTLA